MVVESTLYDALGEDGLEYIANPVVKLRINQGKGGKWRFQGHIGANSADKGRHLLGETVKGHQSADGAVATVYQLLDSEIIVYNEKGQVVRRGRFQDA